MHRTVSLDDGVVLEGEVELVRDGGETRVGRRGQRGTMHAWRKRSETEWSRMLYVRVEGGDRVVEGRELGEELRGMEDVRGSDCVRPGLAQRNSQPALCQGYGIARGAGIEDFLAFGRDIAEGDEEIDVFLLCCCGGVRHDGDVEVRGDISYDVGFFLEGVRDELHKLWFLQRTQGFAQ